MKWKLKSIELELKVNWKISRNESLIKENFILSRGEYESEIAPNIRYSETKSKILENFEELKSQKEMRINPRWCNSFKNAVSNILLKQNCGGDILNVLGLKGLREVETSFSIPIMDPRDVKGYLRSNHQFNIYKLKVSNLESKELLLEVLKCTDKKIRIDANEGFSEISRFLQFENELKGKNIELIEQPFKKSMQEEYKELKARSLFPIFADESVEDDFEPKLFKDQFHGINIKLMKAGGIKKSYELIKKAKAANLKVMLGCMIESSLGIEEAFYLAELADFIDLDGALLTRNDPYTDKFEVTNGKLSYKKSTQK